MKAFRGFFLLWAFLAILRPSPGAAFEEDRVDLFLRTMDAVSARYVDESKTAPDLLLKNAMEGVVKFLDPESLLVAADEKREEAEVGVDVGVKDGVVSILDAIEGGPAAEAGISTGDRLLRIDEEGVSGMKRPEVERKLRGPSGSKVTVLWLNEAGEYREKALRRETVRREAWRKVSLNGVSLIEVTRIDAKSSSEIRAALASADADRNGGAILDLRRATGDIDSSLDIADCLFEGGELLALGRGVSPIYNRRYIAGRKKDALKMDVAVLVGPSTRNGAEVLAAALKAFGRAPLVGSRTFGYAARQKDFPVGREPGRKLRLTVERIQTPLSESITGVGVEPDLAVTERPRDEFDRILLKRRAIEVLVDRFLKDTPPSFDRGEMQKGRLLLSPGMAEGKLRIERENELDQAFLIGLESVLRDLGVEFSRDVLGARREDLISAARVELARRQMKPDAAAAVSMREDRTISMGLSVLKALARTSAQGGLK